MGHQTVHAGRRPGHGRVPRRRVHRDPDDRGTGPPAARPRRPPAPPRPSRRRRTRRCRPATKPAPPRPAGRQPETARRTPRLPRPRRRSGRSPRPASPRALATGAASATCIPNVAGCRNVSHRCRHGEQRRQRQPGPCVELRVEVPHRVAEGGLLVEQPASHPRPVRAVAGEHEHRAARQRTSAPVGSTDGVDPSVSQCCQPLPQRPATRRRPPHPPGRCRNRAPTPRRPRPDRARRSVRRPVRARLPGPEAAARRPPTVRTPPAAPAGTPSLPGRPFLHDHVRVGAAEPERRHPGPRHAARTAATRRDGIRPPAAGRSRSAGSGR